ncbi:neurochondrin family protein [Perilla frutescens var. frutescens]|nr:neurochondrin family protein [Perilla frutescens var. frutescens]
MKLLKGSTDSQRLAGLLLVTKFCDKDDQPTILNVYHAVGSTFLHRLLVTGMGKGGGGGANIDNADRRAYLQLSVTVLAAFARVPEIAATHQMLSKIPLVLEVLPDQSDSSLTEQCFEFLFLVTTAQEDGVITFYRSGGMNVLASQMPALPDGSHVMELAMKLVQLIITKLPAEQVYVEHPSELSKMVSAIAMQFARLHNALKFGALHLLSTLLSSNYSGVLCSVLQSLSDDWSANIRVGIIDVLQNRVGPAEKLHALILAECSISIVGEEWLVGPTNFPDGHSSFPADRCILLVLESSRVEIAVHLNELAYLKYEASENSASNSEAFLGKLRNLGVAFSLVERIIKLIAKFGENEESNSAPIINESTLIKMIGGLNETIGVVLDYLQDAKARDHGDRKGDDLLASVRVVGSYLAEAPSACKEKVEELLDYMLSIEGGDESSPFHSISFLLPMLCQITMKKDGCKLFASTGAFGAVVGLLVSLIDSSDSSIDNSSTILLACDTILNFLLKREQVCFTPENSCSVKLLQALLCWTDDTRDLSIIMMASSICSLILGSTSEEALLRHPEFNTDDLITLSRLMKRSLIACGQDLMSDDAKSEADLHEIVSSGYDSWADRFPHIKQAVGR